ncbi:histidine kinase [Paenibacillus sp. HB172176]|uniref:sensor histidine kinase n=1 Tax=Paenibacillus sp. HB172176 TaxID=2493690 RepID=UPI00143B3AF3|nr:histidine kinase [Paenibacillus sp. HB172176]
MSYKWLKWFILWIPTIVIGVWEYVRHVFLLPYISMKLGNYLAPVFVFLVTLTLLRALFARLEHMQESLNRQRVLKAAFEEREQLARELHDGISQSLFMLSVKLDKLGRAKNETDASETLEVIRKTVRHVNDDVRQSIANLHTAPQPTNSAWLQSIHRWTEELEHSGGIIAEVNWQLPDAMFTSKEKIELLAIMQEALMNVQKHAEASHVRIEARFVDEEQTLFECSIEDDGIGITDERKRKKGAYGLKMMEERAQERGWRVGVDRAEKQGTLVRISGKVFDTD